MNLKVIGAVFLAMTLAAWARAQAAAPATGPADQVPALLKVLYSDNWRQRQQAQDQLVQVGEDALPGLREFCAATMDVEARTRAEAAIKQIEEDLANGPTRITLHMKNAAVADVLEELSKQAKVKVGFEGAASPPPPDALAQLPKVTIDVDREPFWLVMKEIAAKTGIGPSPTTTANRDMIAVSLRSDFGQLPGQLSGCFYVTPNHAIRTRNIDFANARIAQGTAYLYLSIYSDPKLRVMQSTLQLAIQEAVDEKGNSLTNAPPGVASTPYTTVQGFMRTMTVPLVYTPQTGAKIARLRGTARFVVATVSDTWELGNVLNATAATHKVAFGACMVSAVTRTTQDQVRVQAAIEYASATAAQAALLGQMALIQRSVRLVDASGRAWSVGGMSSGGNSARRELQFTFTRSKTVNPPLGDPEKLIWDIPVEIKELTLKVDLKDLPLPQ